MPFAAVSKAERVAAARPTDEFARAFKVATLVAAQQMRALWPIEMLERAIASRNSMPLVTDARWRTIEHQLTESLERALTSKVAEAGEAELQRLDRSPHTHERDPHLLPDASRPQITFKAELAGRFNLRNPFSEDFVRRRTGELIEGITGRARAQIRDTIEAGFVDGVPVRTTARIIRETLGLDPRLTRAVQSNINAMSAAGADDSLIERMAQRYADQLLSYRAELIARTETITASNQGVLDSWRQAGREGLLPAGMQKRWIHAKGSARTCPVCDELGASDPIPMEAEFYSEVLGESFARPPAHPACRCTIGLVRP